MHVMTKPKKRYWQVCYIHRTATLAAAAVWSMTGTKEGKITGDKTEETYKSCRGLEYSIEWVRSFDRVGSKSAERKLRKQAKSDSEVSKRSQLAKYRPDARKRRMKAMHESEVRKRSEKAK